MWIIAGLGNPGPTYARTRHNAGFMVLDAIARRWRVEWHEQRALHVASKTVGDKSVLLVKPQLYMNRSGAAVAQLPSDADAAMTVVYDDLDLPVGHVRVRCRGGSGGHLGLASIIEHFGPEVTRVRVGIGRPPIGSDPADYVLAELSPAETDALQPALDRAGEAVECILTVGAAAAMNRFNTRGEIRAD